MASAVQSEVQEIIRLRETVGVPYMDLSVGDYGISSEVREHLQKPMGPELTYTDLLVWWQRHLGARSYLEIGTSIGKNVFLTLNLFQPPCHCIGVDLADVHPGLQEVLAEEGPGAFRYGPNRYTHVRGSVFEQSTWKKLRSILGHDGLPLVYSDACHSYKGLMTEFSFLRHLIDWRRPFVLLYDDLLVDGLQRPYYPEMCFAFVQIASLIRSDLSPEAEARLLRVRGWCGVHLGKHTMGLITNCPQHVP